MACAEPNANAPRADVLLDTWLTNALLFFREFQAKNGPVAPEDVGSMGYEGRDGLYVQGKVRRAAFVDSGLPLEYYANYNLSFHNPQKYFDTVWSLPTSSLLNCTDTFYDQPLEFRVSSAMQNYLRWTGDSEGVIQQNGEYFAKCPSELPAFWIAPSCRQNVSQCIPVIMQGQGMAEVFMHWATTYGIPMAISHRTTANAFANLADQFRFLFYWYEPETTLIHKEPTRMILPEYSPSSWAAGDFRTAPSATYIAKLVSQHLEVSSPRVRKFIENMKIELSQVVELMAPNGLSQHDPVTLMTPSDLLWSSACNWIKANGHIWQQWIPVTTDCSRGFGIVNADATHVALRSEAVSCEVCPAGRFSTVLSDEIGTTFVCQACEAGWHQSIAGQTSCLPCDPGSFTALTGQAHCSPCARGSYGISSTATSCLPCSSGGSEHWTTSKEDEMDLRWIEVEGATSQGFCHCLPGWHLSPVSGDCEPCMEGSSCVGGGVLQLLPGYYSAKGSPGSVLRCFGDAARCPGGDPGTCAAGRDISSPSCSLCLPGLQPNGPECVECSGGDYAQLFFLALLILALMGGSHIVIALQHRSSGALHFRLLALALCMNQLITCSQLFSVMEQVQGIILEEPFVSFLEFFSFLSLEAVLGSVRSISCVTRVSAEVNLLIRTLLIPCFFALGPLMAQVVLRAILAVPKITLLKTFGFLSLLFYITLSSTFVEPFRCNLHPNGLRTLQTRHEVFCNFSGTHLNMCVISFAVCLLPVGFFALCSYVLLVMFPRRVNDADASFVRACSFLIMRFKPGCENFTIIFLFRNLIFVLSPMMPASGCLFVMGILLVTSIILVAYFQPWRSSVASQLDIVVQLMLLMILLLNSLTVQDVNVELIMILCTLCASSLIFGILVATTYFLVQYVASKFRKRFAFFLCHQRGSSSGFVRLLKMELKNKGCSSFVDADNLTDLTQLFRFVSSDTQMVILVGTPGVLKRKWCLGEIATAYLAKVEMTILSFPTFEMPDELFISNYHEIVPEVVELAVYGLGLSEVQMALRSLKQLKDIPVGDSFSRGRLNEIVDILTRDVETSSTPLTPKTHSGRIMTASNTSWTDYIILADPGNFDAIATAEVLGRFMVSNLPEKGLSPCVFTVEDDISKDTSNIVLLLSEKCFHSEHIAHWLLQSRVPDPKLLPVMADTKFQFPNSTELRSASITCRVDHTAYAQVIKAILLEVAPPFICSESSEVDLLIRSRQICNRLYGDVRLLSTKMVMVGPAHTSERETDAEPVLESSAGPADRPSVTFSPVESSNLSLQLLNRGTSSSAQKQTVGEADAVSTAEVHLASETISQAF
ncbi:Uncharacterized protein SCF082_LOCUS52243 [Durusdinium trenchii]